MAMFRRGLAVLSGLVAMGVAQAPGVAATVQAAKAQSSAAQAGSGFDEMTAAEVKSEAAALLAKAKASPAGMASETLRKYPGHFTMLTVRLKSGGAEEHDRYSDMFVVISGEATEVTGGTVADAKTTAPGEVRGTRVEGGTEHKMQAGDIVHIAPGTPHQTLVAPGQTFVYYVVKVEQQ